MCPAIKHRPVANLCSVSKIFEKLFLKRINELKIVSGIALAGKQEHGSQKIKRLRLQPVCYKCDIRLD